MTSKSGLTPWKFEGQTLWVYYHIRTTTYRKAKRDQVVVVSIKERLGDSSKLDEDSELFRKARRQFTIEFTNGKLALKPFTSQLP